LPEPVSLSRPVRLTAALLLPALLAACVTAPEGMRQADAGNEIAPSPVKPKRVLARDILSEWGTFGIDPRPRAARRAMARLRDDLVQPVASPTIREIMASAACRECEQKPFHGLVLQASATHGVPPALIHAVIQAESGYNPAATSSRQARGLMQVTPGTGRMVGVENSAALYDPRTNIHAGTAYLRMLMENHDTMDEVLAAYNAGPGNVRRYNGVPPFTETRRYVHEVKRSFVRTAAE
jgi:soluble lytic murein transglycosylase-like protein